MIYKNNLAIHIEMNDILDWKKIRNATKPLLFVWGLFIGFNAFGQDNLKAIETSFDQYSQQMFNEKIFAHTDKDFYLAGELLWFKLYVTDDASHKLSDLSKIAYVEIIDSTNKAVLQAKIAIDKGTAKGSFYLPLTLNSGNYILRAYTNWMKNAGANYFFEKPVTIVNVQKIASPKARTFDEKYTIEFFPEGGNLVTELQSKVAFKITDQKGKGINAAGYVTDGTNIVARFNTLHNGTGSFLFTPLTGHSYKAYIQTTNNKTITKELPTVYPSGMVMSVSSDDTNVKVNVQSNIPGENTVYLLVNNASVIKLAEQKTLENGNAIFTFSKKQLPDGISHITIFNSHRQPMCERLFFKKPVDNIQLILTTDKSEYKERKKVEIAVSVEGLSANDSANLSMSVYRLDSLQHPGNNFITSYLYLTSELHGFIDNASSYFTEEGEEDDLENLLLTNGWRRFKWENILHQTKPLFAFVPEYNGHIITGKITEAATREEAKNIETYLSVPGLKTQFIPSTSDDKGNIKFEIEDFYGSSEIIVQPKEIKDNRYKITINDPFSNAYSSVSLPTFNLPADNPNTLLEHSISMQVQNIYNSAKLKRFYQPISDTTAFYLTPDTKYYLDDYTRFNTIEEVLREYVSMVNVTRRNNQYHLPVFDKSREVMFQNDPLLLLDAVPITNFNKFMAFDPLKLKSLEVVNRKYFYGTSVFDGILNWKTYNGDLGNYELDPNAVIVDYEGLQLEREFYSPVYEEEQQNSHLPDFRNVLYWSPDISITQNEKRTISFYTSDLPGEYEVVVQGISSNGLPGSSVMKFEVKK
ncbi:MAG: hypothetical protein ACTHJ5_15060 [Ilyomonas sp.]